MSKRPNRNRSPEVFDSWKYYMQGVGHGVVQCSIELTPEQAKPHVRNLVLISTGNMLNEQARNAEFYVLPVQSTWGELLLERGRQEHLPRKDIT